MEKDLVKISISEEAISRLDSLATQGQEISNIESSFKRMFATCSVVRQLQEAITPKMIEEIAFLQNSSLGFKTDKATTGYDVATLKNCLITAIMAGVPAVGNCFNIIAGNCYITKEGFLHKLRDYKGLSFATTCGIPKTGNGGAIVPVEVEWEIGGEKHTKSLEFAVRMNGGMGADAVCGKATRKALAWLWTTLTNQNLDEGEVEEAPLKREPIKISPIEAEEEERSSSRSQATLLDM